jgi:hypothetical protein
MFQHPAKARNDREDKILRKEKKGRGKEKPLNKHVKFPVLLQKAGNRKNGGGHEAQGDDQPLNIEKKNPDKQKRDTN